MNISFRLPIIKVFHHPVEAFRQLSETKPWPILLTIYVLICLIQTPSTISFVILSKYLPPLPLFQSQWFQTFIGVIVGLTISVITTWAILFCARLMGGKGVFAQVFTCDLFITFIVNVLTFCLKWIPLSGWAITAWGICLYGVAIYAVFNFTVGKAVGAYVFSMIVGSVIFINLLVGCASTLILMRGDSEKSSQEIMQKYGKDKTPTPVIPQSTEHQNTDERSDKKPVEPNTPTESKSFAPLRNMFKAFKHSLNNLHKSD